MRMVRGCDIRESDVVVVVELRKELKTILAPTLCNFELTLGVSPE